MKQPVTLFELLQSLRHPFARRLDLDTLLAHADASAMIGDKVIWLQDLIAWLRSPLIRSDERASLKARGGRIQSVRLRYLFHVLDRHPEHKKTVCAILRSILTETSSLELFSMTGLPRESGFFSEAANLLTRKILPNPSDDFDLAELFTRVFTDESDPDWIESLSADMLGRILQLFTDGDHDLNDVFKPIMTAMSDTLLLLGTNVAALGLSSEIRARTPSFSADSSAFLVIDRRMKEIHLALRTNLKTNTPINYQSEPFNDGCRAEITACRETIKAIYRQLDVSGVSIAIVFKLESISASLTRMETLLRILAPTPMTDPFKTAQRFVADLIRESIASTRLSSLVRVNFDMLARKVVERVGLTGEKYITNTRAEYWQMLTSGAGGGLVTVGTTVLKFVATKAHLPLFFEGFFVSLTYSSTFLLMQAMHFSLATKQPSMTASALANKLRLLNHRRDLNEFVDEVARITRSQFAAALGNIGVVVPTAFLFDIVFQSLFARPVLSAQYAQYVLHSLDPFRSVTVPAAVLTGALLWLSAVTGGWLENWAVFRRLPEAIASHRGLRAIVGEDRARRFSKSFIREIAGVGSNVAIGIYLAFTPIIGRFFGLPLDIRHVTLSSGSLAFAISAIGWHDTDGATFSLACFGILLILILNFGVSFALALFVALRARRIKRAWVYYLIRSVGQRLKTHTLQFFVPRRAGPHDPSDHI